MFSAVLQGVITEASAFAVNLEMTPLRLLRGFLDHVLIASHTSHLLVTNRGRIMTAEQVFVCFALLLGNFINPPAKLGLIMSREEK